VELKILTLRLRTYSKPFFGDVIEAFFGKWNIGDFGLCVNGKSTLARLHFQGNNKWNLQVPSLAKTDFVI
jgi:hypothetical protein